MNRDSYSFKYMEHIEGVFSRIKETQMTIIDEAAKKVTEAIASGHIVHIFGASHAGILAQEMLYHTGGPAAINPILPAEFILNTRLVDQTSAIERLEEYPTVTLNHTVIQEGGVLILHLVSGRNTTVIGMGIKARKKGACMVVITNITYTNGVTSRRSSGKKLSEVCDIYIDNCGDFEDFSMLLSGMEQRIAPISSVIRCGIVNMMEICIVGHLLAMNVIPLIFHSANVDGGMEFNQMLFEEYGE